MATDKGEAMQSIQAHMEDMRSLTLCKICLRPFYEPFILGCGHSFCYSCLRSWFGGPDERRKNKNCPDCRSDVKTAPAPNYLLREISHLFLTRQELLPEDESVAEHKRDQDEEAELLSKDKKGLGLFQGVFKLPHFHPLMPGPIHDFEDHVDRCPVCAHEIEDGRCNNCHLVFGDVTDISDDDSDLSGLSDMDDDSQSESDEDGSGHDEALPHPHFHAIDIEDEDEDEDSSEVNEYDRHDDFIDNDDEIDMDGIDMPVGYGDYPTDAATPYSDEELSDSDIHFDNHVRRRPVRVIHDSDEESISTNPEAWGHPPRTGRRQIVISDDEDEDVPTSQVSNRSTSEPAVETRPFMMPDLSDAVSEDDPNDRSSEEESSSDDGRSSSDVESDSSGSDSDSSDATIEDSPAYGGGNVEEDSDIGDNAGQDSDDTVIPPPRPKRIRQSRLQEHRDSRVRRSHSDSANGNMARGRVRIPHVDGSTRNNRRGRLTSVY